MHMRTIAALAVVATLSASPSMAQSMNASFYGREFQGKPMANGSPFNMYAFTVAHKTMRLGTRVCITNLRNGKHARAQVTDRGPYVRGRDIDLSYALAKYLGTYDAGVAHVDVVAC